MNISISNVRSSWDIVVTAHEPEPCILAFIAYHLNIGASEIFLYLDRPGNASEKLERTLSKKTNVHVRICDSEYWAKLMGRRPRHVPQRQTANAQDAMNKSKADWLLHCDIDEFVANDERVFDRLDSAPLTTDSIMLRVAERVTTQSDPEENIYSSTFRRTTPLALDHELVDVYGDFASFLSKNTAGYPTGKSFVRTNQGIIMGVHEPKGCEGGRAVSQESLPISSIFHFDGFSQKAFISKMQFHRENGRRLPSLAKRALQVQYLEAHLDDPMALEVFYEGLKMISEDQEAFLWRKGWLMHHDLDILTHLQNEFPDSGYRLTIDELVWSS